MGKIRKILETELVGGTQSTDVYPVTSTKAVYDENNVRLDTILKPATKEATGLMSSEDKNKIDNYVGTRLNVPNITYVNPEFQEECTSIGYEGIKYTNGVCTFNVSNGDIDIKSDNIKINGTEISYTRGSSSTTLNQTGLIVDDTSSDSADNSTNRITITSNTIKYKYLKDNSMTDEEDESGDYTYTLPKANGRLLVDSENEANVNYVNSTKDKTLTTGYNGIKYIVVNDEISDVIFDVNDKGVCNAKQFVCPSSLGKTSSTTIINSESIDIFCNAPFLSKSIYISDNSITFSNTSSGWDDTEDGGNTLKTIYSIDNIKKGNFTYSFPGKSGTIELVDEEKDNKLKQITNSDSLNIGYQYSTSFSSLEELADYVNNNPTTEQYMSYINNEGVGSFLLAKNGEVSCSVMSDTIGFTVLKGTLDFDNKEVINEKIVSFDTNEAILPNCIKILDDIDNNKAYELNIAKCLELGILTEVDKSSINAKAEKINF